MIKAPLNLLSEKLNRPNFFISHDEAGVSGLFIILAGLSSPMSFWKHGRHKCREHPGSDRGSSGADPSQLRILPWLGTLT